MTLDASASLATTLANWIKYGLRSIEADQRLLRGEDVNGFHHKRRTGAKRACRLDEVYCVSCKNKHSMIDEDIAASLGAVAASCVDGMALGQRAGTQMANLGRMGCHSKAALHQSQTRDSRLMCSGSLYRDWAESHIRIRKLADLARGKGQAA
ncbi:hypothetical protein ILFOPFJJ_00257 [Ensifer psoraleae]|nr:hypothetical protein [Sinorhizobium psoraleae]